MEEQFDFDIVLVKSSVPEGLYELRRDVYSIENDFLTEDEFVIPEDHIGQHVCIYKGSLLIASMLGLPAVDSPFPRLTGVNPEGISDCYFSTKGIIRKEYRSRHGFWPLLTYLTFYEGIKQGFVDNLSLFENKDYVELLMDIEWLTGLPKVMYKGNNQSYQLHPGRVNLAYGMEEAWDVLLEDSKDKINRLGYVLEPS